MASTGSPTTRIFGGGALTRRLCVQHCGAKLSGVSEEGLRRATEKMSAAGVADDAIAAFARFYRQIEHGASGLIAEDDIEPLVELDTLAGLRIDEAQVRAAADATAVIKLNGGLGTSMGMDRAKSLLPVKDGLTSSTSSSARSCGPENPYDARLPLIFMNSFRTRDDMLAALVPYPDLDQGLPSDFLQSREPKLRADDLYPVTWPADPSWSGARPDTATSTRRCGRPGCWPCLSDAGFRYAFCSNSDNLGAMAEPRIAAWMAENDIPFVMESCRRTPADRKGGHLALRRSGRPPGPPRDGADLAGGYRRAAGPRTSPLLQQQQPLARPRALQRRARPAPAACSICR